MFRFDSDIYLWALLLVPLLLLAGFMAYRRRRRRIQAFGDKDLVRSMSSGVSAVRRFAKYFLLLLSVVALVFVLARPQMGTVISQDKRKGLEIVIALDVSQSMLAEDVAPSRLQKSKLLVESLLEHFTEDKIGLVVFAGEAFVQMPLTVDYVSAKMFLQGISTSMLTAQGTDIARAVNLSVNCFSSQNNIGKAILLITDGENHEGDVERIMTEAKRRGIHVFVLGVGDTAPVPIPIGNGAHLKDADNNVVMSTLNEDMCRQIAQMAGGRYYHVTNEKSVEDRLNKELSKIQKGETEDVVYSEYAEQFQLFALLALLFLVLEVIVREAENPLFKRINLFNRNSNGEK